MLGGWPFSYPADGDVLFLPQCLFVWWTQNRQRITEGCGLGVTEEASVLNGFGRMWRECDS